LHTLRGAALTSTQTGDIFLSMSGIFDITSVEWKAVRPEITEGVFGRAMLDSNVKAVLTRVAPGGKFRMHADKYAHLFYFLSGQGIVSIGKEKYEARSGTVVQVDAGTAHSYENTGTDDLVLVSLNLPV
jgi:mannose-6-phosphate isomerase-like protein (cupin superfamily)